MRGRILIERLGLQAKYKRKDPIPCLWTKPPENVVKLNADGSMTDERCSAVGVIRDSEGEVLLAYTSGGGLRLAEAVVTPVANCVIPIICRNGEIFNFLDPPIDKDLVPHLPIDANLTPGCIQEQYLVEKAMMYCMEYIHDGNLGSHKNGRRVIMNEDTESAHPMDKKGKQYVLPNVEYQQVRKWVLTHSPKNVEWEE
ncbi:hypothetical protein IFM89_032809 [Coptis chinensis]|uniref:RNase H type-1 domain-containing protein n=1 Tax=Coptis chinensis TaxID=261450 RepID=A0A835HR53_9MAGN|nr:hypothetical protein IFM89_032809 [Coptis chinensis]